MVGCRYEAKNTLDRNYLRLAEERGAVVHPEREATLVRRVDDGWEVETEHPGAWLRRRRVVFRAEQVVLAAGVLGTLEAALPVRARRPERRHARALELGDDRRCGRARPLRRLLGGHRHRLVVPSERRHAHRAGPLPEGLEHDGSLLDDARRRRRAGAASAALARRLASPPAAIRALALGASAGRSARCMLLVMQARDNSVRIRWSGRRLRTERDDGTPRRRPGSRKATMRRASQRT